MNLIPEIEYYRSEIEAVQPVIIKQNLDNISQIESDIGYRDDLFTNQAGWVSRRILSVGCKRANRMWAKYKISNKFGYVILALMVLIAVLQIKMRK